MTDPLRCDVRSCRDPDTDLYPPHTDGDERPERWCRRHARMLIGPDAEPLARADPRRVNAGATPEDSPAWTPPW